MPSKVKGPHHRGTYHVRSRAVVAAAYANPATPCWRCGRTLPQHPPTKTGRAPYWTAGHLNDGEVGGVLAPEIASCNYSAGATQGNRNRRTTQRTELSW